MRGMAVAVVLLGLLAVSGEAGACKLPRSQPLGPPSPTAVRVAAEAVEVDFSHELGLFFGCSGSVVITLVAPKHDVVGAIVRRVRGNFPYGLALGDDVLKAYDGEVTISAHGFGPVWGELSVEWVLADGSITAPTQVSFRDLGALPWVAGVLAVLVLVTVLLVRRQRATERAIAHIRGGS